MVISDKHTDRKHFSKLTSQGIGWTNVHPDFQNGSKKLFHVDSE